MTGDQEMRSSRPPLPERAEVVVAGGGIAGLASAWRLAAAGAEVVLLDAGAPSRPPASGVAAGMIAPVGEARWGEERLLAAALASAEIWAEFASALEADSGVSIPLRESGAIHIALDRDEAAELDRLDAYWGGLGLKVERLLPSTARRLEPGLTTRVAAAVHAPAEREVDPRVVLDALGRALDARGVGIHPATVIEIGSDGEVRTDRGTITAGRVVVALGAWSKQAMPGLEALPVRPIRGEILRLRARDPELLPCERIIVGERFYLVPRESGEVVIGATVEERGFDASVSAGGVHELLREAYRAIPEVAELEFVEASAGLRPGTPDNAAIVGAIADTRLVAATGLYRNGILLAPLVADGVVAELAGRPLPPEIAGLGPSRFIDQSPAETAEDRKGAE